MTTDYVAQQLALEEQLCADSHHRLLLDEAKLQNKACPRNDLTAAGSALVNQAVLELLPYWDEKEWKGTPRATVEPRQWVHQHFKGDSLGLSYLIVTTSMQRIHTIPNEISMRERIARAVVKEYEARLFKKLHPGYFHTLLNRMKKTPSAREKSRVLATGFRKADLDVRSHELYDIPNLYSLGQYLWLTLVKTLPWLFELRRIYVPGYKNKRLVACLTAQVEDWHAGYIAALAKHSVVMPPMVCPPVPYSSDGSGGFLSMPNYPVKAVRNYPTDRIGWETGCWLPSLEAIQQTQWQVDIPVLSTMQALIKDNHTSLPTYDIPEVPYPGALDKEDPLWVNYRQQCRARQEKQHKQAGRKIGMLSASDTAYKMAKYTSIYMPQQCDFRGRLYSQSSALSPQGADYSKGLLRFAQGKPLGDRGAYWLAVHIANLCGVDKVSYAERVQWTHEHSDDICRWATSPTSEIGWIDQDKPWQLLSAAQDWLGYDKEGGTFCSSTPVAMDGSNNGLQHLSAMLRDDVGAYHVNMCPTEVPQDVYAFVAKKLIEVLQEKQRIGGLWTVKKGTDKEAHFNEAQLARILLENIGIDRKLLKRPTMTYAYNATAHSMGQYMRSDEGCIADRKEAGADLEGISEYLLGIWLSSPTYHTISDNLRGAGRVMKWLSQAANAIARGGHKSIAFTTPSGFRFSQHLEYAKMKRTSMKFEGKHVVFNIPGELESRPAKARSSFAPNMVHSLDASHMMMAVDLMRKQGLDSFAMVHDSYGCHACDVDTMQGAIRESFVGLYQDWCPMKMLTELYPDVELPQLPEYGTYDINNVLNAPYFFS